MGTQTMGSQGDIGDTSKAPTLSRQGSLYSLTLDEVQNQLGNLGKPLSSMNLDELLRNVWTVEANHSVLGISISKNLDNVAQIDTQEGLGPRPGPTLNKQSSFNFTQDLSKKTVDELWREIQQGKRSVEERDSDGQNTLGEMTLEDFLVQAGVVLEVVGGGTDGGGGGDLNVGGRSKVPYYGQWMPDQLVPQQQEHNMMAMIMPGQHISVGGGALSDTAYTEAQLGVSTGPLSDTQAVGRKRVNAGDVVEKTVERRQKRMIKNRESAARSRARKQAYTHELENKVSRLEEENQRLRRMREVEKELPRVPLPQPKFQLRRTNSAPP